MQLVLTACPTRASARNAVCARTRLLQLAPRGRRLAVAPQAFKQDKDKKQEPAERVQQQLQQLQARWEGVQYKKSVLTILGTTAAGLLLSSAALSAVDGVPLLPQLLQLVGLVYVFNFFWRYVLFYQGRKQLLASSARLAQVLRDKLEGPPPPSPSPARPPKDAAHGGAEEGGVRADLFPPVSARGGPEHAQASAQQPPSGEDTAASAADD